ncbi:hypothetical protein INT47_012297 [Mucor saturninus]|uniref:RRM domain-containing protein n=1 Tax=Mucor saturninus TaxID=64648 RepID=A0A8H7QHY6_9FUNG|nr:hypothetical protein INT47_012297 [Mucor saturninus]
MSEPMKEEVPPTTKPVEKEVPTGPVDKRIFIGGLHPTVSEKEIQDRFSKFGKVNTVHVAKNTADECRGFAHMTIHTTPKQWESCLSVYNGAKWRGQELKLEEAKPDYQVRFQQRQEKIKEQEEKKRKRLLRWNDSEGFHAKDMTPVTDNNMGTRKGWKRGRYGRAIAVMRLKKNDGTKFVFEPTHYKNNLEKLYNIGVRMKPVSQLITKVEEDDDDEDEEARWPKLRRLSNDDQEEEEEEEEREDYKMTDDEKRRFAMEKMFADQHAKKQMMQKALAAAQGDKQHTSFEQEEEEKVDDVFQMDLDNEEKPVEAKKWMFDSDDEEEEEEEFNIEINPVLEGEAGRKRLELQKKFKGDDRFKLGEDFIDPAEKEAQKKEVGDAISQELGADKSQAMDVLNAMFGERRVDPKVQPRNTAWTNPARFDPDAEDSSQYLADKPQREEEEEEEEEFTPRVESAKPIVSTAKHFEVSTNLKPLFGDAEEAPFTLFGGNNNSTPVTTKPLFAPTLNSKSGKDFTSNFIPQKPEGQIGLGVMFFFHLDDPSLMKKSCYSYDAAGIFQQKSDEKDSYESKWRTQRPIIKEILKKRQKNAVKNQKKRSTTRDSK